MWQYTTLLSDILCCIVSGMFHSKQKLVLPIVLLWECFALIHHWYRILLIRCIRVKLSKRNLLRIFETILLLLVFKKHEGQFRTKISSKLALLNTDIWVSANSGKVPPTFTIFQQIATQVIRALLRIWYNS